MGVWNNNPLQTPPADSSTPPGRLAGGSGLSNLSRSRIWLRRKIFFFWPVEVWLLWHVPKASKGCEAVVLVALGRSRGWERGIHGCGTVGGPSGGLEQQPPTNSTSRLQYTAGEASGGVGSEQSLRKTSSRDARRSRMRIKEKNLHF